MVQEYYDSDTFYSIIPDEIWKLRKVGNGSS